MANQFKSFIERIRNTEESVKRIWIGVFSAGAMVVMLSVWGVYGVLTSGPREVAVSRSIPSNVFVSEKVTEEDKEGRLALLTQALKKGYVGISDAFQKSYNLKVEKEEEDFIYDGLKPVVPTDLP